MVLPHPYGSLRLFSCDITPRLFIPSTETYTSLSCAQAGVHKKAHALLRGLVSFRHPNGTSAARKAE